MHHGIEDGSHGDPTARAFHRALTGIRRPVHMWYVCLMRKDPYYGGPEEGGWWGSDTVLVAWAEYVRREDAVAAREAVVLLATQMTREAEREFNGACLRDCERCEARGEDPADLPEVNGPSRYHVRLTSKLPPAIDAGPRHYE